VSQKNWMPTTSVVNTSEFHQRIPINSTAKHTWPAAHAWQFMTTLQFRETLTRMEMALTDNDLHSCGETQKKSRTVDSCAPTIGKLDSSLSIGYILQVNHAVA